MTPRPSDTRPQCAVCGRRWPVESSSDLLCRVEASTLGGRMTRLYVAGPMSAFSDADYNFAEFNRAARELRAAGYEVENPADTGIIDGWEWKDYIRSALGQLITCQGIALLYGWQMSLGARFERHVAQTLGMDIRLWEDWL